MQIEDLFGPAILWGSAEAHFPRPFQDFGF